MSSQSEIRKRSAHRDRAKRIRCNSHRLKRNSSGLVFPKHPKPFAASLNLPLSHSRYEYISEATLPPHKKEKWRERRIVFNPWKDASPTVKHKEFPHHIVSSLIGVTKNTNCGSQVPLNADDIEPEVKPDIQAKWKPLNPPKTGRQGDINPLTYMGELEMLLWQRTHDPDIIRQIIADRKNGVKERFVPLPKSQLKDSFKKELFIPVRTKATGSDSLFTKSYEYMTCDSLPENDFELLCKAWKFPDFQQPSAFHTGDNRKIPEFPHVLYSRLKDIYHIPPRSQWSRCMNN